MPGPRLPLPPPRHQMMANDLVIRFGTENSAHQEVKIKRPPAQADGRRKDGHISCCPMPAVPLRLRSGSQPGHISTFPRYIFLPFLLPSPYTTCLLHYLPATALRLCVVVNISGRRRISYLHPAHTGHTPHTTHTAHTGGWFGSVAHPHPSHLLDQGSLHCTDSWQPHTSPPGEQQQPNNLSWEVIFFLPPLLRSNFPLRRLEAWLDLSNLCFHPVPSPQVMGLLSTGGGGWQRKIHHFLCLVPTRAHWPHGHALRQWVG